MTLRPYQIRDLNEIRTAMRTHRSVLLVQPTGSGKGFLAAHIVHSAEAKGKNTIFMVNRRTLVRDMSKRLSKLGIEHGVIMAGERFKPWCRTHVASIDTLHRRAVLPKADLICLDEAHFALSPIFIKVLARYENAKILSMTATPQRSDGRGLGEICQYMVKGPSVEELIGLGFLVPSRVFAPSAPDTSQIKKVAGDFDQKGLAQVCDRSALIGDIVEHWKNLAPNRKTVCFGVDQNHAKHIQQQFLDVGVNFAYVDAKTSDEDRDKIWDGLDSGDIMGVSSVGVVAYGWDHPVVSCVIMARPTMSLTLHLQQIGRGARPSPGKTDLLILDHASNTHRHGFYETPREWSLAGTPKGKPEDRTPPISTCRACFACFRTGPLKCPYCGAEIGRQAREIHVEDGKLEEVKRDAARQAMRDRVPETAKFQQLIELVRTARIRGYHNTWVNIKFERIVGHYPPRDWMKIAEAKVIEEREQPLLAEGK